MKIYILCSHGGLHQDWTEIDDSELEKWRTTGSLYEGDLIIYPDKVLVVEKREEIDLVIKEED